MDKHILLERAVRRPTVDTPSLPGKAEYDVQAGYWKVEGKPLVQTTDGPLVTKKADQETGEDQKGE